jgi:hypothetical protein
MEEERVEMKFAENIDESLKGKRFFLYLLMRGIASKNRGNKYYFTFFYACYKILNGKIIKRVRKVKLSFTRIVVLHGRCNSSERKWPYLRAVFGLVRYLIKN